MHDNFVKLDCLLLSNNKSDLEILREEGFVNPRTASSPRRAQLSAINASREPIKTWLMVAKEGSRARLARSISVSNFTRLPVLCCACYSGARERAGSIFAGPRRGLGVSRQRDKSLINAVRPRADVIKFPLSCAVSRSRVPCPLRSRLRPPQLAKNIVWSLSNSALRSFALQCGSLESDRVGESTIVNSFDNFGTSWLLCRSLESTVSFFACFYEIP